MALFKDGLMATITKKLGCALAASGCFLVAIGALVGAVVGVYVAIQALFPWQVP